VKFVRSALLACAAATLPLMPVTAEANSYTHTDATGDMLAFAGESETGTPAPDQANMDIATSTVKHKARVVIMQMTYRDLAAVSQDAMAGHYFAIKTPTMRRVVVLFTGSVFGNGGKAKLTKPDGKTVACKVRHTIDYTAHTIVVKVPRSCLGKPRWVKVGMAGFTSHGEGDSSIAYVDDALTNGTIGARGPSYTPKIRR